MKEGLYKADFRTPLGSGAGVVFLRGGKLWGGDSSMRYTGTYSVEGGSLTASVDVKRHSSGQLSVFGQDNVQISLKGKASDTEALVNGSAPQAPGVGFSASLTFLSD